MCVKGRRCFSCFGERCLKDVLKICIFTQGTNVKEYFARLQLFGIVWAVSVTSLTFRASEKRAPHALHVVLCLLFLVFCTALHAAYTPAAINPALECAHCR